VDNLFCARYFSIKPLDLNEVTEILGRKLHKVLEAHVFLRLEPRSAGIQVLSNLLLTDSYAALRPSSEMSFAKEYSWLYGSGFPL
jgi:hypothetical protein